MEDEGLEKSLVVGRNPLAVCLRIPKPTVPRWLINWRAQLPPEYEEGDEVKVRVRENGVLRPVKMEVVRSELRGGKWAYQVKRSGAARIHTDENGNRWFREDTLDWW